MKALTYASILKTGPGTSIQDLGRLGKTKYGIPQSGAMDQRSSRWVNHLLQNEETAAVLEISQPGFSIQFGAATEIALGGAVAQIKLNGTMLFNSSPIGIDEHDILEIGAFVKGSRLYLGIKDGFQTEEVMGSRSYYEGLTLRSQAPPGTALHYLSYANRLPSRNAKIRFPTAWYETNSVFVHAGPDFYRLAEEEKQRLFNAPFHVSNLSNRMGVQLSELLENKLPELPTNPVFPGLVQLTSGGKLLVLLRDAQVTGGYPRILLLDETSQWIMAQKKPGDTIYFRLRQP